MSKQVEMIKDGKPVLVDIETGEIEEKKLKPYEVAVQQFGKCLMASLQLDYQLFAFEAAKLADLPLGFTFKEMENLKKSMRSVGDEAIDLIETPLRSWLKRTNAVYATQLQEAKEQHATRIAQLEADLGSATTKWVKANHELHVSKIYVRDLEDDHEQRQYTIVRLDAEIENHKKVKADDEASFTRLGDLIGRLNVQISDLKKEVVELPELKEKYKEQTERLYGLDASLARTSIVLKDEQERRTGLEGECRRLAVQLLDAHKMKNDQIGRLQLIVKWQTKIGVGMGGLFAAAMAERCFGMLAMIFG